MAVTPSNTLPLGTAMPDAELPDPSGSLWRLSERKGENGLLVMFICNHCPYVIHMAPFLEPLYNRLHDLGLRCVAINANDAKAYPADSPEKMQEFAARYRLPFPYLYDEKQKVARAYSAACTPEFFLFAADDRLVYHGQLDDSRPGKPIPVTGEDLISAAEKMVQGQAVPAGEQKPSVGCSIKWKR